MTFTTRRRMMALAGAAAAASGLPLGARAQAPAGEFPHGKPVRIINPFPVGGGPDGVSRLLADKLSRAWGTPVTVDNRPGGNGFIAIDAFKRGAKDGTDIIILDNVHLVAYPALFKKLPYNPARDFDVLLPLFKAWFFFAVGANSPYHTVADIVGAAKAHPGKLNYGSWSIGNPVHLGSEMFATATGTRMQHVVFKETTQLYASVSTGEIDFALGSAATAGPLYRAGKLRFIALTAPQRWPAYPDVPTVGESGGPMGFEVSGSNVLAVPPGLPSATAGKIRRDVAQALAGPDVREKFNSFGYAPFRVTTEQFQQFQKTESLRWAHVIRQADIVLD